MTPKQLKQHLLSGHTISPVRRCFRLGARILARSADRRPGGFRHLQHRPKPVVIGDPEDGERVGTKENL